MKNRPTRWAISKLKEHPQQAAIFGALAEEELAALAESMKGGLRDPVEILPDGTIICGHQRVGAAKVLGWKEIDIVIREDLVAGGAAAIETYFIEDNFIRRQLSPLARARCIKRLLELETGYRSNRFGCGEKEALKAQIAARMHLSPRSVNRYLLLLEAPVIVQEAFDRGELSLINAGKVALLPKPIQADIARRLAARERPARVFAAALAQTSQENDGAERSFLRLVGALGREGPKLQGQASKIGAGVLQRWLPALKKATALLSEMIEEGQGETPRGQQPRP